MKNLYQCKFKVYIKESRKYDTMIYVTASSYKQAIQLGIQRLNSNLEPVKIQIGEENLQEVIKLSDEDGIIQEDE